MKFDVEHNRRRQKTHFRDMGSGAQKKKDKVELERALGVAVDRESGGASALFQYLSPLLLPVTAMAIQK